MEAGIRRPGDFCWINVVTPRPAEAREFFARVLGWTYVEMPGIGHGVQVGGRNIGGIFDIEGPGCPPDMAPVMGVMIKVEDADASCAKIGALGGQAKPAFDINDAGRMAVCYDPNGAAFDIWEPKAMPGTDADRFVHGSPSWPESITTDVDRASRFYCDLFGWTAEVKPMPGMDYTVFKNGGTEIAGMMSLPAIPPHWSTYFTVQDVDEAVRVAKELGAEVYVPPMDIPEVGRFCGLISPQGVRFSAIQYLPRPRA